MDRSIEARIVSLKKKLDSAKEKEAMLKGRLQENKKRMLKHGCNNLKEATALLEMEELEVEKLESLLEKKLTSFEEKYKL